MISSIRKDLVSGFSVFLLAMPLCLGIAMASNFPPVAGLLTAIVGGIVASCIGSSPLTIKGPAAGLIVISLGAVNDLGGGNLQLGYEYALAAGVVAAVIQILLALFKKGVLAEIFPPAVIHGMLAAIGVIIVSKQTYIMMGVPAFGSAPLELIANIPFALMRENPLIFGIGILALFLALVWPHIKKLSFIPASLVILVVVIPISMYCEIGVDHDYIFFNHTYHLSSNYLIHMPTKFFEAFQFPDFSVVFSPVSIKYIIMFALVGSIESLLTVCAVDTIVEDSKPSDLNKDLFATGVCNLICALIGGLPMISEVVRSKANIDYGATSAKSNFFHGIFMLIAIFVFPTIINLIPLSALAALLVFVGLKLAAPREFIHVYKLGSDQLLMFLVTFSVTLHTDLLKGVICGVVLKIILHIARGNSIKSLLNPIVKAEVQGNKVDIEVEGPLTFLGYVKLKNVITKTIKENKIEHIVVNLSLVTFIDHTVLKKLHSLSREYPDLKLSIEENQELVPLYNSHLATKKKQAV